MRKLFCCLLAVAVMFGGFSFKFAFAEDVLGSVDGGVSIVEGGSDKDSQITDDSDAPSDASQQEPGMKTDSEVDQTGNGDIDDERSLNAEENTADVNAANQENITQNDKVIENKLAADSHLNSAPVRIFRLYNSKTGDHVYTKSATEKYNLTIGGYWYDEGDAFYAVSKSSKPVYRLFYPGTSDHLFTASKTERDTMIKNHWRYEGIAFYAMTGVDMRPVYRVYNPKARQAAHLISVSKHECDQLKSCGWVSEGTAFGVLKTTVGLRSGVGKPVDVYRVYNWISGEHFLTANAQERNDLLSKWEWEDEGIAFRMPKKSSRPVYRLLNPFSGEHLYTASGSEKNATEKNGWRFEGIAFYASDEARCGVHRLFNPFESQFTHLYTLSKNETNVLTGSGWHLDGMSFYAYAKGEDVPYHPTHPWQEKQFYSESSPTDYMIYISLSNHEVSVMQGGWHNWHLVRTFAMSAGSQRTPTPRGTYFVSGRGTGFGWGYTAWFYTIITGPYYIHSILYNQGSMTRVQDGRLGLDISHGCVRVPLDDAYWVYDNIPNGTKIMIE